MAVREVTNPLVHKVELNNSNTARNDETTMTKVEEILSRKEAMAARRYSAAQLETMALEAENEAAKLRGEPPKYQYGGNRMEGDNDKSEQEKIINARKQVIDAAKGMLEYGVDPAVVGQMMLGLPPVGNSGLAAMMPMSTKGGTTVDDVVKIVNLVTDRKGGGGGVDVEKLLEQMDKRFEQVIKAISSSSTDPVAYAKRQGQAFAAYMEAFDSLSSMRGGNNKPDISEIKEKNRHEERMQELTTEKEHRGKLIGLAESIPKKIGEGVAERYLSGSSGVTDDDGIQKFKCTDCGKDILVPNANADSITCASCGAIFKRGET